MEASFHPGAWDKTREDLAWDLHEDGLVAWASFDRLARSCSPGWDPLAGQEEHLCWEAHSFLVLQVQVEEDLGLVGVVLEDLVLEGRVEFDREVLDLEAIDQEDLGRAELDLVHPDLEVLVDLVDQEVVNWKHRELTKLGLMLL